MDRGRARVKMRAMGLGRRIARAVGAGALIAACFAGGTLLRLAHSPVALPDWVLTRIEARASRDLGGARAELGEVALGWDRAAGALRLVVREATLSRDGRPLAVLPEARVAVGARALLGGAVRPRSLALDGLELDAARDGSGRWSLAWGGGGGALPRDGAALLAAVDAAMDAPALEGLAEIALRDVRVRVSDAATGLSEVVAGDAMLARDGPGARLDLSARGEGSGAELTATLRRDAAGGRAAVALEGLTIAALREALPEVRALRLADGSLRADARIALGVDGVAGPIEGHVEASDLTVAGRRSERLRLGFAWTPGDRRIALPELTLRSEDLSLAASGQAILEAGLVGPMQLQLRLSEAVLDPEGLFEHPVRFDDGVVEARLSQRPLALRVGQAMVTGPAGLARGSADLTFPDGRPAGAVDAEVPAMAVGDLRPLWPEGLAPEARRWFRENLIDGRARDVRAALRLTPGAAPRVAASLAFEEGTVLYMRTMPPAERARGAIQVTGGRVSIRVDAGSVPALGPDASPSPELGRVDVAGTRIVLPDALSRPPEGRVDLRARARVGDVLTLLDNPPFRLLTRLRRSSALASGVAEARVSVVLPLRRGNAPADVDWRVDARLRDVTSDRIVPGRRLDADALTLTADARAVAVAGRMRLEGMPFEGRWRQALPPPATEPPDPDAPPRAVALPEPGRVRGTATVTPAGLARLGVAPAALRLDGTARAVVDVTIPQGSPPRLRIESDLAGLAVSLPAIGWRKAAGTRADLALDAVLGDAPEVRSLTLDAPGLSAEGRLAFAGGALAEGRFDAVRTPWFRGVVTLTGRGRGVAPAVVVRGGRADLRGALDALDGGGGGGGGGEGAPVTVSLDRLQVTDAIALTDLRADLRGGAGRFSGAVNGAAAVSGALAPRDGGTAVQVDAADAGAALRAAGLFRDARGGRMRLILTPGPAPGVLDGTVRGEGITVRDAPALASLLQALSVVGLVQQLAGQGLPFETVEADIQLRPGGVVLRRGAAVGPAMSITADGAFDTGRGRLDLQGVVSPIYFVNGLFGALFSRRDEGLFGFSYRLTGATASPQVSVNPLSILTPGRFRDIFRRAPPGG